jgi:hypothetical protein
VRFTDNTYSGGEYFGQVPELAMRKRPSGVDAAIAEEAWKHGDEYWECAACAELG